MSEDKTVAEPRKTKVASAKRSYVVAKEKVVQTTRKGPLKGGEKLTADDIPGGVKSLQILLDKRIVQEA